MAEALPDSYRMLMRRFGVRVDAGGRVSEEGVVPAKFWVVLSGRLAVQTLAPDGTRAIAREAGPGESVAVVAALTGRSTFAGAIALEPTELLAIPVEAVLDAFRIAPELALSLLREFARERNDVGAGAPTGDRVRGPGVRAARLARATDRPATPEAASAASAAPAAGASRAARREAAARDVVAVPGKFNEEWFFVDERTCPVSGTTFAYLRTRAGALRPSGRDSDFRIVYSTVDPSLYSVIVCPGCSYASYADDFDDVSSAEIEALQGAQAQRDHFGRPNLGGERTIEAAAVSLKLARACYAMRAAGPRRLAGLLHRQAWIERARGYVEAERRLLREARDTYIRAFEGDDELSDAGAARAAYVIGDLSLRLDDPMTGARWLDVCLKSPQLTEQKGLERMARDRLHEARELVGELRKTA